MAYPILRIEFNYYLFALTFNRSLLKSNNHYSNTGRIKLIVNIGVAQTSKFISKDVILMT